MVISQPIRMPGSPSAFDSDETPMTRSESGRERQRAVERHLAIGLVHEQAGPGCASTELGRPAKVRLGHHLAGRVVRVRERHEPASGLMSAASRSGSTAHRSS